MKSIDKHGAGRPFKMEAWLEQLKAVLETENILFLSDNDLRFLVNERLSQENQITRRTLENWKAGKFIPNEEVGQEFMNCIEKALIKQKQFLAKKMIEDDKNWQRFAWIMERKFTEWNLKHISENINRNEQSTTINITASNDYQRRLIDNIINADFEIVEPIKNITSNDNKEDDEYIF